MRNSTLLTLDPLSKNDKDLWVEIYTDQVTMCHIGPALSKEKAIELFEKAIARNNNLRYTIRRNHDNERVGMIGLKKIPDKASVYELGVMIHSDYSNKGYAYKATQLLLTLAFEQLSAQSIVTFCNINNQGANRISSALGFIAKGIVKAQHSQQSSNQWEMTIEQYNASYWRHKTIENR